MVAACPLPWPRGTPIRIHRMAEALVDRGHTVDIVTYALGDAAIPFPYTLHRVGTQGRGTKSQPGPTLRKLLWLDPQLVARLTQLLRLHPYDMIHAHHYEGLMIALAARRFAGACPIVYDSHTLLASELPHYRVGLTGGVKRAVGGLIDRQLPRRADAVVTVTEGMRNWLVDVGGVAPERCISIPNGVEFRHFVAGARHGVLDRDEPRVVFAGNLADYQGIDLLFEAFALVRRERPSVRLVLLGSTELGVHAPLAEGLGIMPAIDLEQPDFAELPARLGAGNVLVNPRTACDGIPQKLLNYMASGRPIVSFSGSAAPLTHGRNALLADDGDVAEFAQAILRLLDDRALSQRLAAEAQRTVGTDHDWLRVAARVEQVYAGLVRQGVPQLAPAT